MLAVALVPCLALLPLPGRARPPSMVAATTDYLTWAADHGIVAHVHVVLLVPSEPTPVMREVLHDYADVTYLNGDTPSDHPVPPF